jgi:hypothetical protein
LIEGYQSIGGNVIAPAAAGFSITAAGVYVHGKHCSNAYSYSVSAHAAPFPFEIRIVKQFQCYCVFTDRACVFLIVQTLHGVSAIRVPFFDTTLHEIVIVSLKYAPRFKNITFGSAVMGLRYGGV